MSILILQQKQDCHSCVLTINNKIHDFCKIDFPIAFSGQQQFVTTKKSTIIFMCANHVFSYSSVTF